MSLIKDKILFSHDELTPKDLEFPEIHSNLGEFILQGFDKTIKEHGDYDWLINGPYDLFGLTSTIGFKRKKASEIQPEARNIAAAFYKYGFRKGGTVHFAIPNSTEIHIIAIGVWLCGGIISLGDPGLSFKVLKAQLEDTNAKMIVCFDGSRKVIYDVLQDMNLLGKLPVVVMELPCPKVGQDLTITEPGFQFYKDFIKSAPDTSALPKIGKVDPGDTVIIFWSSGTTGAPKGIQHGIKYFQHFFKGVEERKNLSPPREKLLHTTCYFHVGGFFTPLEGMVKPFSYIFSHGPDMDDSATAEILYKEVDKYKPIMMICGSHHLVLLSQSPPKDKSLDLSSVKVVMPMGSTVPPTLFEALKLNFSKLLFVYLIYGMTEIGAGVTQSRDVKMLGSVVKDVCIKIVDPETGHLCGPNEVGEMLVKILRGTFMNGYLNRPEETQNFFAPDGYAHTGDLAHYDNNGNLYFDGRLKELIKYKNFHLYPLEIETIINSHPYVAESAVFGKPDPLVQELVTAIVIKVPGSNVSEADIIELVDVNVDDAKKLRGGVIFAEKLPKNPQGKIQRRLLPSSMID